MAEKQNKNVSKTKNKNVSPLAWLLAGMGAYGFYLFARGVGWVKDKPYKDYERLSKQPFMIDPTFYNRRHGEPGNFDCYQDHTWSWKMQILDKFEEELDPLLITNEITLLGTFKKYIKSQFDYSYISQLYTSIKGDDFNTLLRYKIDAWTDDLALEELIRYLKQLPVSLNPSCLCNSTTQQERLHNKIYSEMRKTKDDSLGNYIKEKNKAEKKLLCKYKGPRIYGYGW